MIDDTKISAAVIIVIGYVLAGLTLYHDDYPRDSVEFLGSLLFMGFGFSIILMGIVVSIIYWGQKIIRIFKK